MKVGILILFFFFFCQGQILREQKRLPNQGPRPKPPLKLKKQKIDTTFNQFRQTHHGHPALISFGPQSENELKYREEIFQRNKNRINTDNEDDSLTYNQDLNQFAILDEDEFLFYYATLQPGRTSRVLQASPLTIFSSIDYSYATPGVRNQGICGSCYAFAIADAISSQRYINGCQFPIQLSPQDIITNSPNFGCAGGSFETSFDYIQKAGIHYQYAYPYANQYSATTQIGQILSSDSVSSQLFINRYEISSCDALVNALSSSGPIPVGIDASDSAFYSGGTFSSRSFSVNHGVLLLAYFNEGYYVQNSWGSSWGIDGGFMWISVDQNAGICSYGIEIFLGSEKSSDCFSF